MKDFPWAILASAGLLSMMSTQIVVAQTPSPAASPEDASIGEDIVVTARRKSELLQDVPESVTALSGSAIQNLDIFEFEDLSNVVSGLQLSAANGNTATLRGVSFNAAQQTNATVQMYLNDSPVNAVYLFQSMFDVDQVEVLRGPQGTLRGEASPSGSITLTTRKPDLYNYSGTANVTVTGLGGRNVQGAISLPLINGIFGIRLAGTIDDTDDGILSANSSADPYKHTTAFRVTGLLEPIENLTGLISYQNLFSKSADFGSALIGNGAPGGLVPGTTIAAPPAGYNGPVIPAYTLDTVASQPSIAETRLQFLNMQLDYSFPGPKLSYVGSWSKFSTPSEFNDGNTANMVPGTYPGITVNADGSIWTHELRLASQDRVFSVFDYVLGAFYSRTNVGTNANFGPAFLPGAFGSPLLAQPLLQSPDLRYSIVPDASVPSNEEEYSFFVNVTAHLNDSTELSAGGRFITSKVDNTSVTTIGSGYTAAPLPAAFCPFAGGTFGTTYPGVCDIPIPGSIVGSVTTDYTKKPKIFNVSLSHHFSDAIMGYATVGSSWRPGPQQSNIVNGTNNPTLNSLTYLTDEKSTSYEIGTKSMWLDRIRLNIDYFHQKFNGFIYGTTPVNYLSDNGISAPSIVSQTFNLNAPAVVDGVDVDASIAITKRWIFSGMFSWANGRLDNAAIPCNSGNFNGIPDSVTPSVSSFLAHGVFIAECRSTASTAQTPKWNFSLQSEYSRPITGAVDGFMHGLYTFYPSNPNASPPYVVPSYALLNMYVGARSPQRGWEIQAFAKNIAGTHTMTSLGSSQITSGGGLANSFGSSGYYDVTYAPRREFGLSANYTF